VPGCRCHSASGQSTRSESIDFNGAPGTGCSGSSVVAGRVTGRHTPKNTTSAEGTFAVEDFEGGRWAVRGVRTGGEGGQKSSEHVRPTKGL